ncbi:MAG: diguanylate cyclase [Ramlibacter sp.]|nr:diguanylate cyclase [Ramlibacter sp.]
MVFPTGRSLGRWLALAAVVLGTLMPASGHAQATLSYWIDTSGQADAATAASATYKPVTGAVPVQAAPARTWLWWQQPADAKVGRYVWLDYARVTHLEAWVWQDGAWVSQGVSGVSLPRSAWPVPGRVPMLRLSPTPEPRAVLLAVRSDLPLGLGWCVQDSLEMLRSQQAESMLLGGFFGIGLIALWFSGVIAVNRRDRAVLAGAWLTLLGFLVQGVFLGVAGQYLWPEQPGWTMWAAPVLSALVIAALPLMLLAVTTPAQRPRPVRELLLAVLAAPLLATPVALSLGARAASHTLDVLFALTLAACAWAAWQAIRRGNRAMRPLAMSLLPACAGGVANVLRDANLIAATNWLAQYGLQVGSLVTVPLMLWVLQRRAREMRDAGMLHAGGSQLDPATGLTSERVARLRMERMWLRARRFRHRSGLLLVELCNLDALQAQEGRRAAEAALLVAASRLRRIAGDFDTAARWHGNQFLLLLEGPCSDDELMDCATRIVAAGLKRSPLIPGPTPLQFRVVISSIDDQGPQPQHTLQAATAAMDTLRTQEDGRAILWVRREGPTTV